MTSVEINWRAVDELTAIARSRLNLDDEIHRSMELADLLGKDNPLPFWEKLKGAGNSFGHLVLAVVTTMELGEREVRDAHPGRPLGPEKLKAAAKLLDEIIKFKGLGGLLLERIDYYVLEWMITSVVGMLNNLLGKEWGEEAERRLKAA